MSSVRGWPFSFYRPARCQDGVDNRLAQTGPAPRVRNAVRGARGRQPSTLSAAHHQRGVHGGGPLRISGRVPAELRFELPLEAFASGDVRLVHAVA